MVLFSELSPSDQENLSGGGFTSAPPTEGTEVGWGDQEEGSCSGYERPRGFSWVTQGERQPRGVMGLGVMGRSMRTRLGAIYFRVFG